MIPPHSDHILLARGTGFHWSAPPPTDVASSQHITGADPDAAICAILAQLREGNLDQTQHLIRLMRTHHIEWVWGHCSTLVAFAASARDLGVFIDGFGAEIESHDGVTIEWVIETLAMSTHLRTVPYIIDLHRRMVPNDRLRYCGVVERLSFMLESERGEVAKGPENLLLNPDHEIWEDDDWSFDFEPYEAMLLAKTRQLESQLRPGASAVFRNEPLSLPKLAEFALTKVQRNRDSEILSTIRLILEAYTGRNLTGFYRLEDYKLDSLAAAAMLEDMLESGELDRYEPGVRYFFGHRIPD